MIPAVTHAAVTVSEVAWMGTTNSANDEWIELHNDGTATALDGWQLSDGRNLTIELSGTIGAGARAVLERTDDSSAPGSAFLIYTGALSNSGATLTLTRSDGSIADQVAGGENWEAIGGDNTTKETAQYTSGGWVTGSPTPGDAPTQSAHGEQTDSKEETEETESSSDASARTDEKTIQMTLSENTLKLTLRAPERAYVHQPVTFALTTSGVTKGLRNTLSYTWNFGDLSTGRTHEATHTYAHPGTYVVVAHAGFGRQQATVRHEITVLPVSFSVTRNADGDLQIHNDAKYEIDLSGYSLRGVETIVFPDHTILLPNATLTIPQSNIGGPVAFLLDQKHAIVASTIPPHVTSEETSQVALQPEEYVGAQAPQRTNTTEKTPEAFAFSSAPSDRESDAEARPTTTHTDRVVSHATGSQVAAVGEAGMPVPNKKLPYLGLIAVLVIGLMSVYLSRTHN